MTNERHRGVVLVLSLLFIGLGSRSQATTEPQETTTRLRSGGVDSGGGVSRSTYALRLFMGQSTPIGGSTISR